MFMHASLFNLFLHLNLHTKNVMNMYVQQIFEMMFQKQALPTFQRLQLFLTLTNQIMIGNIFSRLSEERQQITLQLCATYLQVKKIGLVDHKLLHVDKNVDNA